MPSEQHHWVYVGNWERHKSPPQNGLGIFRYDTASSALDLLKSVAPEITVGAVCLSPDGGALYCTDEYDTLPGYFLGGGGQLYAFKIDVETGDLTEISRRPSLGSLPSYVATDATGDYLIATHHTDRTPVTKVRKDAAGRFGVALEYDDATTVLFRLEPDGSIGEPCDVYTHSGDGGPLPRQTHPQIHSVTMAPSGGFFIVCDKGNDEIVAFRIDRENHRLEVCGSPYRSAPGSSPRYSAFHPNRPFLYVNHETKPILASFRFDDRGGLDLINVTNVAPDGFENVSAIKQSDVRIHPSGRFLYTLLRGVDAVSVFEIDQEDGKLRWLQTAALDAAGPRGCAISPDGRFLLIAALSGHRVVSWSIDEDGTISPTGKGVSQPNPGTVTFRDLRQSW